MQEEVNEKTISLCIKGGKITAQILKAALIKLLAEMDKKKQQEKGKGQCKRTGKQSIRFDLQSIGTIAFPLFCFLLAEGFQHTRSKKRYIGLMLAFALISEVPFDIGFFSAYSRMEDTFPFYLKYQNVFFTLFLGLLTLVCLERFSCKSDLPVDRIKSAVLQVLSVVLFSGIAEGIHCDYGMQGILFISAFYICRNHRIYQVLLFLLAYMGTTGNQPPLCTLLACLLILLYNGKRGKLKLKYFFYVFYPAHILVLYLIQIGLGKYLLK